MRGPGRQRCRGLTIVSTLVVSGGNALSVMAQYAFDDVRWSPQLRHVGRHGAPDVMQPPSLHLAAKLAIEQRLGGAPGGKAVVAAGAEQTVTIELLRKAADDVERGGREHDRVSVLVLATR